MGLLVNSALPISIPALNLCDHPLLFVAFLSRKAHILRLVGMPECTHADSIGQRAIAHACHGLPVIFSFGQGKQVSQHVRQHQQRHSVKFGASVSWNAARRFSEGNRLRGSLNHCPVRYYWYGAGANRQQHHGAWQRKSIFSPVCQNGSSADGDTAPAQSPTAVAGLGLTNGGALTFVVTGSVDYGGGTPSDSPDGQTASAGFYATQHDVENGMGGYIAPANALVGIFLGTGQPDLTSAPASLNFTGTGGIGTSFTTLTPQLKQVFFIGDGTSWVGKPAVCSSSRSRLERSVFI